MFHRSSGLVLTDNAAPPSFRSHILFQKIKLADKMVKIKKNIVEQRQTAATTDTQTLPSVH